MNKKGITLIEILAYIIIGLILIFTLITFVYDRVKEKREIKKDQEKFCVVVCENESFKIDQNYCVCSNGQKYKIR